MQWTDVVKPPAPRMLRQFAGLCLVVFGGLAAWRAWHGTVDAWTYGLAAASVGLGGLGLAVPSAIRPVYTAWMIAAFPIGWTISKIALGATFFLVFTPVGLFFRLVGRDALRLKRGGASYWVDKPGARSGREYLKQF